MPTPSEPPPLVEAREALAKAEDQAADLEAKARAARRRATVARTHYDNVLLEYGGQMKLWDER